VPIRSDFKNESDWLEHLHMWFAGQALTGMLAAGQIWSNIGNPIDEWATRAYDLASAMTAHLSSTSEPRDEEEEGGD
jgi:hypothetical protein